MTLHRDPFRLLLFALSITQALIYSERCIRCIEIDVYFHATSYDDGSFIFWNKSESLMTILPMIETNMEILNNNFNKTPFTFVWKNQDAISVTNNTMWTSNICFFVRMNRLQEDWVFSGDPFTTINVYLGHQMEYGEITTGCGSFPFTSSINYVGMSYDILPPGGNGLTLAHEVAHWMGLFHTYESSFNSYENPCDPRNPGDWVDDTPLQTQFNASLYANETSFDSCPDQPGGDSFWNLMNSVCLKRACFGERGFFTDGQIQRMYEEWLFLRKFDEDCGAEEAMLRISIGTSGFLYGTLVLFDKDGNEVYSLFKHSISYVLYADMCVKKYVPYVAIIYSPYAEYLNEMKMISFQVDGQLTQTISSKAYEVSVAQQDVYTAYTILLAPSVTGSSALSSYIATTPLSRAYNTTQLGCTTSAAFLKIDTKGPSPHNELFDFSGNRVAIGDFACIPRNSSFFYLISSFSNSNATLLEIFMDGYLIKSLSGPFHDVFVGFPRIVSTILSSELLSGSSQSESSLSSVPSLTSASTPSAAPTESDSLSLPSPVPSSTQSVQPTEGNSNPIQSSLPIIARSAEPTEAEFELLISSSPSSLQTAISTADDSGSVSLPLSSSSAAQSTILTAGQMTWIMSTLFTLFS